MYNFSKESLWGIDLGGTKIEGVILKSAEDPEVIFRERVPTEAEMGYWHIIYQIKKVVDMMSAAAGCTPGKIGIATPGTVVPQTGLMKNCNTTALNGKPLKQDLIRILNAGVEIANDANCFALAETQLGIVKKEFPTANVVFGIIMGTGVGGGLVVNQKVINGYHGLGGEWGHNYLNEYDGQLCYCGKSGCNESILSGPSLQDYYYSLTKLKRSMKEIAQLAEAGKDNSAQKTISRLNDYFGLAVSVLVNIIDPDVIVVGGGVGNIDSIYTEGRANIHKYVFDREFEAPVVKPLLGDSAGVFGAAFLAT